MKIREDRQIISLNAFNDESWKVVRNNAYSAYMVGLSVTSFMHFAVGIGLWWVLSIPFMVTGVIMAFGSEYVRSQTAVWVDQMMTFKRTEETEDLPPHPVKENSPELAVEINDAGGSRLCTVHLTRDQVREMVCAWDSGPSLTRSMLSAEAWPNLTRRWQGGEIQMIFRKMGLTDHRNRFIGGWGSEAEAGPPEVEPQTDTGRGVGG